MSLFKKFKRKVETISSDDDYHIYGEICEEIERGERDLGVWGKAFSQAHGDESKAKAIYIELMVALRKEYLREQQKLELEIHKRHQSRLKKARIELEVAKTQRDKAIKSLSNKKTGAWLSALISILGIVVINLGKVEFGATMALLGGLFFLINITTIDPAKKSAEESIELVDDLKKHLGKIK